MFFSWSPDAIQRMAALGREFESQGHYRLAEWVFKRVTEAETPSSTAFFILGRIQTQRGNLLEGKLSYTRCLEMKPNFYQCRVNFFESCRQEYWVPPKSRLTRYLPSNQTTSESPDTQLQRLHHKLRHAIFPQMWFEIARWDSDESNGSVFEHLKNIGIQMKGWRSRKFRKSLVESESWLEEVFDEFSSPIPAHQKAAERKARISRRNAPPLDVIGLRDSDDTIGYHLEIISGGSLSFIPLDKLERIELGSRSDFTETKLQFRDDSTQKVVIPATYYSSRHAGMPELTRGEFSILRDLYRGLQIGVGRRVFQARDAVSNESVAIGVHEVSRIELL